MTLIRAFFNGSDYDICRLRGIFVSTARKFRNADFLFGMEPDRGLREQGRQTGFRGHHRFLRQSRNRNPFPYGSPFGKRGHHEQMELGRLQESFDDAHASERRGRFRLNGTDCGYRDGIVIDELRSGRKDQFRCYGMELPLNALSFQTASLRRIPVIGNQHLLDLIGLNGHRMERLIVYDGIRKRLNLNACADGKTRNCGGKYQDGVRNRHFQRIRSIGSGLVLRDLSDGKIRLGLSMFDMSRDGAYEHRRNEHCLLMLQDHDFDELANQGGLREHEVT